MLRNTALAVVLSACGREKREPRVTPDASMSATRTATHRTEREAAVVATAALNARFACGTTSHQHVPRIVVPVSARDCMSCMGIGHFVRHIRADLGVTPSEEWIASAATDTSVVCSYLTTERVESPVVVVPDDAFDPSLPRHVSVAIITPSAHVGRVVSGPDDAAVINQLAALRLAVPASPLHTNQCCTPTNKETEP
jgi:hypothetical protein